MTGFEPAASTSRTKATRVRTTDIQTTCDDGGEPLQERLQELAGFLHADGGLERLAKLLVRNLDDQQRRRLVELLGIAKENQ